MAKFRLRRLASGAAAGELLEEAGEVGDVESGRGGAVVAVGVGEARGCSCARAIAQGETAASAAIVAQRDRRMMFSLLSAGLSAWGPGTCRGSAVHCGGGMRRGRAGSPEKTDFRFQISEASGVGAASAGVAPGGRARATRPLGAGPA